MFAPCCGQLDRGNVYRHVIYAHSPEQLGIASESLERQQAALAPERVWTSVVPAELFYAAEPRHQRYLERGMRGTPQCATKGCTDPIRCYGGNAPPASVSAVSAALELRGGASRLSRGVARHPRKLIVSSRRTSHARHLPVAMETSRTSWEADSLGGIRNLAKVDSSVPAPAADEVVVSVRAIGLNFADIFCALGLYEAANQVLDEEGCGSFCPGLEFAGLAISCGSDVSGIRPGDRVYGFTRFGAYRTAVVQREVFVRRVPDGWSYAEAASLLAQGLTAWHGLVELGNIRAGSKVLVPSAAGGVGCAAMQIGTHLGCQMYGNVRSEEKAAFLRDRYPDANVFVRRGPREYARQLAELPGGGTFDCVLESLGGRYLDASLAALEPMGKLITFGATHSYGGASGGFLKWLTLVPGHLLRRCTPIDPGTLVASNRGVLGFNMIWLTDREDMLTRELDEMLSRGGMLERPPAVGKVFDFDELPEAMEYLNSGQSTGKVVVEVRPAQADAKP